MKEVTREKFYETVGPQDACVSVENEYKYPYTSLYKLRHSHRVIGKAVDSYTDNILNKHPIVTKYYIAP